MVVLTHLILNLLLGLSAALGLLEEAVGPLGLHLAKLGLRKVLRALSVYLGLLLVEHLADLVHQCRAFLFIGKRFLGPASLVMVSLAIHGFMVWAVLVPDLVHEVFLLERLVKLLLLPGISEVQALLQRVRPVVIRRDVFFIALIRILLELL